MRRTLLLFALVTGFTMGLSAQKVQIGNLYYYLDDQDHTATVTWDKFGEKTNYQGFDTIKIPDAVSHEGKSYRVDKIASFAFNSCQMTTVVMGNNIETIGQSAFERCNNLSSVEWGQAGKLKLIDSNAFSSCGITNVTLPDGIRTIWNNFNDCSKLQTVTIPASLEEIKSTCFVCCNALTAIHVDPANPNYCDEDGRLYDKQKTILLAYPLGRTDKRFVVPASVDTIGDLVFDHSGEYPQTIILHAGVKHIGWHTFYFSELDTLISYPIVPPTLDTETFRWCEAMMYAPDECYMDYRAAWHELVYPLSSLTEGVETIPSSSPAIRKELIDGQVFIRREGKTYNLTGQAIEN